MEQDLCITVTAMGKVNWVITLKCGIKDHQRRHCREHDAPRRVSDQPLKVQREREIKRVRERERLSACVCERERVCECGREIEKEKEREREREREREKARGGRRPDVKSATTAQRKREHLK